MVNRLKSNEQQKNTLINLVTLCFCEVVKHLTEKVKTPSFFNPTKDEYEPFVLVFIIIRFKINFAFYRNNKIQT